MNSYPTIFSGSWDSSVINKDGLLLSKRSDCVLITWIFMMMIITSSYTASLTSILTVQLSTRGLNSLIRSSYPIGYQAGSFTKSYLMEELNIEESRLVELKTPKEYDNPLKLGPRKGGVAAIIDEVPYVQLFLSTHCEYKTVGQEFTKSGWGFAFQRGSPLAVDLSITLLRLSGDGKLQRIHDLWLKPQVQTCTPQKETDSSQLSFGNFWGLFTVCGIAFVIHVMRLLTVHFMRRSQDPTRQNSEGSAEIEGSIQIEET